MSAMPHDPTKKRKRGSTKFNQTRKRRDTAARKAAAATAATPNVATSSTDGLDTSVSDAPPPQVGIARSAAAGGGRVRAGLGARAMRAGLVLSVAAIAAASAAGNGQADQRTPDVAPGIMDVSSGSDDESDDESDDASETELRRGGRERMQAEHPHADPGDSFHTWTYMSRRGAISYVYEHVFDLAPEEEWERQDGTISRIAEHLKLPKGSQRTVRSVLKATLECHANEEHYDGAVRHGSGGQNKIIKPGSYEEQLAADLIEAGHSYTDATNQINDDLMARAEAADEPWVEIGA